MVESADEDLESVDDLENVLCLVASMCPTSWKITSLTFLQGIFWCLSLCCSSMIMSVITFEALYARLCLIGSNIFI